MGRFEEHRAALPALPAAELERLAGDVRWRVREGVAMGLQRLGDTDLPRLRTLAGLDPGL